MSCWSHRRIYIPNCSSPNHWRYWIFEKKKERKQITKAPSTTVIAIRSKGLGLVCLASGSADWKDIPVSLEGSLLYINLISSRYWSHLASDIRNYSLENGVRGMLLWLLNKRSFPQSLPFPEVFLPHSTDITAFQLLQNNPHYFNERGKQIEESLRESSFLVISVNRKVNSIFKKE